MPARPGRFCVACRRDIPAGDYCSSCKPPRRRGPFELAYRDPVYKRAQRAVKAWMGQPCPTCGDRMTRRNPPTVAHRQRLAEGGTNDPANLGVECRRCNSGWRAPRA